MEFLDIGTVAARTGIPPSTLRYYEELGLIGSVARRGLRRQFEPLVIVQLALINLCKMAGFSLGDTAKMFGKDGRPDLSRPQLHERADALDQQISELTTLRDALRHVADCPAPSHMECAKFRRLLRMAAGRPRPANARG
ncbi:helix-turn-helix domain-containing protein [Acuticoccus sp. MNP-M23]|uniref:helix-turn-helix domain-containing protein n=1 Tax=Acuticoccus sp. MNP-M23 TaxID=3072793 RepID=UPI002816927E|nr:helix-turn-helix domain-containing protein [Acuticoccus sp. MNP-M23]WMS41471.1 helix-turn-helix domain-containing protein [Acuticoccus sp. MNP-M23]